MHLLRHVTGKTKALRQNACLVSIQYADVDSAHSTLTLSKTVDASTQHYKLDDGTTLRIKNSNQVVQIC